MVKIYKFIVNVLFVITIILLLAYMMLRITDKIEIYKVKTGSMEEKIHVGDYILIYRKDSYNVGEIVTYTSNDGFITHRIVRKENGKVITKGDANNAEDKEILESTIVGMVIMSGGVLNTIINYKYVFVCILLSMYLFSCYFNSREKLNQDEEEINENVKEDNIVFENKNVEVNKLETEEKIEEKNEEKIENKIDETIEEKTENKIEKHNNDKKIEPVKKNKTNGKTKTNKNELKKTENEKK